MQKLINMRKNIFQSGFTTFGSDGYGFTLIEILVAITIVSILSGIVLHSASASLRNARDGQRKSDLKKVQIALQQFYSDQGFYPSSFGHPNNLELETSVSITNCTGIAVSGCIPRRTYLQHTPIETVFKQTNHYCYLAYSSKQFADANPNSTDCDNTASGGYCRYYEAFARLENGLVNTYSCEDHVPPDPGGFNHRVTAND
jgi:prepilin-type N-terminal cleavage/methylation domain-containing protein